MIEKRTVLVLGAGASLPYGLPLGNELKNLIFALLNNVSERHKLADLLKMNEPDIRRFAKELSESGLDSIDAWLERRSEFTELGKTCVAHIIINSEKPGYLMNSEMHRKDPFKADWCRIVWQKMVDGTRSVAELRNNRIIFVTFNYDRALEAYMMMAAKNTFGQDEKACAEAIRGITIIHAYGQAGFLEWQSNPNKMQIIPYGSTTDWKGAQTCANAIKIVGEDRSNGDELIQASEAIRRAKKVYFLGFGYHKENMKRLRPENFDNKPIVKGTYLHEYMAPESITSEELNGLGYSIELHNTNMKTFVQEIAGI
ncbi:MAG: hypothetical protein JW725_05635 [Candidatus Babeliaceae bacterium]|nr:hypothetical protein [Candidatus Babeliaceae bacterium]